MTVNTAFRIACTSFAMDDDAIDPRSVRIEFPPQRMRSIDDLGVGSIGRRRDREMVESCCSGHGAIAQQLHVVQRAGEVCGDGIADLGERNKVVLGLVEMNG